MISLFVSAVYSLGLSIRYQSALKIHLREYKRYFAKSFNLAICYNGFAPTGGLRSAVGAGKAAFYSCAYDVVTDWRKFNQGDFEIFKK